MFWFSLIFDVNLRLYLFMLILLHFPSMRLECAALTWDVSQFQGLCQGLGLGFVAKQDVHAGQDLQQCFGVILADIFRGQADREHLNANKI